MIKNKEKYAASGAPMYDSHGNNVNKKRQIYQINCSYGKKHVGETGNL